MSTETTQNKLESEATSDYSVLVRNEPFQWLLAEKLNLSAAQIAILGAIVAFVYIGIMGPIADSMNQGPGARVSDPQHLYFGVFNILYLWPLLFAAYAWQPQAALKAFVSLRTNDCVHQALPATVPPAPPYSSYLDSIAASIYSKYVTVGAAAVGLTFVLANEFYVWPSEAAEQGGGHFIFNVPWYHGASLAFFFLWGYLLGLVLIRLVIINRHVSQLTRHYSLIVRPLFPDGAGGIGGFGSYLLTQGLFAVCFGIIVLAYSLQRLLIGHDLFSSIDVLLFWILYISIIIIIVISPILRIHHLMVHNREAELAPTAAQYATVLESQKRNGQFTPEKLKQENELLIQISTKYEQIDSAYACWPVNTRSLRNFAIVAILPIATNILLLALELFSN